MMTMTTTELRQSEEQPVPRWKIPVLLTDMKARADHIGGEIKQADANIVVAKRRQEEVREMQRIADQAVGAAITIAADRRAERDALAAAMHAHVLSLGESPPPTTGDANAAD